MSLSRVRCFFDIEVDDIALGRIIFELFNDVCPKTCENFRGLCTGEMGIGKTTGKELHYRNVKFHRVIKDFMVQAGDFSAGNGTGGESIYGGQFEDENFDINHDTPFLLSMANRGKDTNGSQFFLTTQTASHLDEKHVVFGRVISGKEVVVSIENLPVDNRSRPLQQAIIANCGELVLQTSGQLKTKEKKKKKKKIEETVELEDDKKKKKKKKEKKHKHKKDKQGDSDEEMGNEEEEGMLEEQDEEVEEQEHVSSSSGPSGPYKSHPLATVSVINPDEIPEVPKNRFLDRGFQNRRNDSREEEEEQSGRIKSKANVRFFTKSGRKVKGRGLLRYRTPSRSRSRSRSATPPHWRQAQRRTVTYEKYQRQTEELESREREIEKRRKRREERHRLQSGDERDDEDESSWRPEQVKLGSVISGRMNLIESEPQMEDKTARDWRVARHETLIEDKENRDRLDVNRKDVKDLRHKIKGKGSSHGFVKGSIDKRNRKDDDTLDFDDNALDYEAPSENEDEDEEEEGEAEEDSGKEEKRASIHTTRNGRDRSSLDRDRDRDRERVNRHRGDYSRDSNWSNRNRGDRSRGGRDRRERGSSRSRDRRRNSRDRKPRNGSRERNRSLGRRSDRGSGKSRMRSRSKSRSNSDS